MSSSADDSTEARLLEYGREFIRGYKWAIDVNYLGARTFIHETGLDNDYFPLYGRELGVNVAMAALFTKTDFYMFLTKQPDTSIENYFDAGADLSRDWTLSVPMDQRIETVKTLLDLESSDLFKLSPHNEVISVPGANMMALSVLRIGEAGYRHGVESGNLAGGSAENEIPRLKEQLKAASTRTRIMTRYLQLTQSEMSPQARGQEFEKLWREVLDQYGWRPKKIRIAGEDNDFTAIYQGLHILGEVRWFKTPMTGAKMREFLAKLDPRPQTIGLFVSISGVDQGGMSVVKRAINTKTVVIFGINDVEEIILRSADPGPIFDEKLRDAYDYLFEITEDS